jgi:hypothetical protein
VRVGLSCERCMHLTQGTFVPWLELVENIECRMSNKEPQKDEVFTSTFDIPWSPLAPPKAGKPCSAFCGSRAFHHNSVALY